MHSIHQPVSILPSRAAGPSRTRLFIWRNSSGSSPPTTVKPNPRRLFFSLVLMKVPFSSDRLRVKKGFPPGQRSTGNSIYTNDDITAQTKLSCFGVGVRIACFYNCYGPCDIWASVGCLCSLVQHKHNDSSLSPKQSKPSPTLLGQLLLDFSCC